MSRRRSSEDILDATNNNKKQKTTSAISKRLCSHCGGEVVGTAEDQSHSGCKEQEEVCKRIVKDFVNYYSSTTNVLYIGIGVNCVYDLPNARNLTKAEKEERTRKKLSKIEELTRKVSALRNSHGGYLLIQLVGLSPDDTYTGALDAFMAVPLNRLIEDGNLFCDVYTKTHIQEFDHFKDNPDCSNIVMLHVVASSFITTLEINSKMALDDRIETPTPHTMISWVRKMKENEKNNERKDIGEECNRILKMKDFPEGLQESRNIQFKSFDLDNFPIMSREEMTEYILDSTRLPEYVSAFAKNEKGGHFLFGVREHESTFIGFNYVSKRAEAHGVNCDDSFKDDVKSKLLDRILVCNPNGITQDQKIFEVHMNDTLKNVYKPDKSLGPVLQVSVKPVAGVVFSKKGGPLAYKVEKNDVVSAQFRNGSGLSTSQRKHFDATMRDTIKGYIARRHHVEELYANE